MQRNTAERSKLIAALQSSSVPLTAAEIKARVGSAAHMATVYRGLEALVQSGTARRVELGGRAARYELAADHHHHIVCTECGEIEDVHAEPSGLERRAFKLSKRFARIDAHSLEFFGLCKRCA